MSRASIFCDIGTDNFCWVVTTFDSQIQIQDFKLVSMHRTVKDVAKFVKDMNETYDPIMWYIEKQNWRNVKCSKIENYIVALLTEYKRRYKLVAPNQKFKRLNICSLSYPDRKKAIVCIGKYMLHDFIMSEELRNQVNQMQKQDDFFDCVTMAATTFLEDLSKYCNYLAMETKYSLHSVPTYENLREGAIPETVSGAQRQTVTQNVAQTIEQNAQVTLEIPTQEPASLLNWADEVDG
jgi:hypothetical protein